MTFPCNRNLHQRTYCTDTGNVKMLGQPAGLSTVPITNVGCAMVMVLAIALLMFVPLIVMELPLSLSLLMFVPELAFALSLAIASRVALALMFEASPPEPLRSELVGHHAPVCSAHISSVISKPL